MLMFVVSNSLGDSVSKLLFVNHNDLGVIEMMFMRGVIVLFFLIALIGNRFKQIMWTSIPRKMYFPLFVRVNTGLLAFFCMN